MNSDRECMTVSEWFGRSDREDKTKLLLAVERERRKGSDVWWKGMEEE